jgi:hypothetical protein
MLIILKIYIMEKKTIAGSQIVSYNKRWQKPVITEYNVYNLLSTSTKLPYNYFAFPWAALLDEMCPGMKSKPPLQRIIESFKKTSITYCTVVQHISFMRLLETFKSCNITIVFTPHCTLKDREIAKTHGIQLYGFPLYATVKKIPTSIVLPLHTRPYLTSFIGQYDSKSYLTNVRSKIFDLFSTYSDCVIIRRYEWHFQSVVYRNLPMTNIKFERKYRDTLANSKFSLCPSGTGPNSIRIWESMSFGTIPVVLADTLVLPTIKTMPWSSAIIIWKESEIDKLYAHLKSISKEEMESKSKACLQLFDTYFSDKAFCRVLFEHFA